AEIAERMPAAANTLCAPSASNRVGYEAISIIAAPSASAEREDVSLDVGTAEGDVERSVHDRAALPDQLVQPRLAHRPPTLLVDVAAVGVARRLAVDEHVERHRLAAQDQVDVAGVETKQDPAAGFVQHARAARDRPVPGERPAVQHQPIGSAVLARV